MVFRDSMYGTLNSLSLPLPGGSWVGKVGFFSRTPLRGLKNTTLLTADEPPSKTQTQMILGFAAPA